MAKASHTPGPWKTLANEIQSDDGHCIAEVTGGDGCSYYDDDANAECAANLRLIAAAPELLAACQQMLHVTEGDEQDEAFDWVRTAIAKATGE